MIVFNITTQVEWDIADEWLNWQREEHIPEIMATNLFDDYRIFRLMDIEGDDGPTYTVQYFTSAKDRYEQYIQKEAPMLLEKAFKKWGNQFISHRSVMELVN